jgi:predicted O-methyltransferase YrrM
VIEVGSGYSSALMLDVADEFGLRDTRFVFVDPNPERLTAALREGDADRVEIVTTAVQDLGVAHFDSLRAGDMLFIDSSHVTKVGSDVNFLVFQVLPRLAEGVLVHFHDVFWPFEYPKEWVLGGRCWNEAYLLRAFLQYNSRFEIVLFNSFLARRHSGFVAATLPDVLPDPGGSLWLRRGGGRREGLSGLE